MRAIDFACQFLVNIAEDDMTPGLRLVLLCAVAGMQTSEEIADFTGMVPGTCTNILKILEKRGYLGSLGTHIKVFLPTEKGRERVRKILDFHLQSKKRK